jgi:iron complex outermembrane recepter protein
MFRPTLLALSILTSPWVHADTTIEGTITDKNLRPIDGAIIYVTGKALPIKTDANGRFSLSNLPDTSEIHINASGYSYKTLRFKALPQNELTIVLNNSAMEHIDVTATPLHSSALESAQPVSVVAADTLRRVQQSTLGETLKNEVGVHSSYFGPVSSTPIIRGLSGPRVLITQNSLDVGDASRIGPDHVVATEASTAEQIEILRGPSTLFFGSGAIGGVVNIVDDRIPQNSEPTGAFIIGHNTVNAENEASFAYTGGNAQMAFHVDGFMRDGSDFKIPGTALLETEAEHIEEAHEEHAKGVLENSSAQSHGFNVGASLLFDEGYVGFSFGRLDRLNGIPGHSDEHGTEEHTGEEEVLVKSDLIQDRWQLISEIASKSGWLDTVNTRLSYTDYQHKEIEGEEIGTIFKNQTLQARVDLILQEFAGWSGAISLEYKRSDFEAIGDEAFTPPSLTEQQAIAIMQEKHTGPLLWQFGARVESVDIAADPIPWEMHDEATGFVEETILVLKDTRFTPFSLSAGVVWDFAEQYNAAISFTHAQRAPSASELYSFGPHLGTSSFEVGALFSLHEDDELHFDPDNSVSKERSNNIDISLRKHAGDMGWIVNAFYNTIDDFYYERYTGFSSDALHEEDPTAQEGHAHTDLPVYIFDRAPATFYGLEARWSWLIHPSFTLNLWGDSVRGKLDQGGNLPRIPPTRLGAELNASHGPWNADVTINHYGDQNDVALLETSTPGYTMLDTHIAYTLPYKGTDYSVFFKATNLTNTDARVHSSFLKESVPLPGRGFSIGIRGYF